MDLRTNFTLKAWVNPDTSVSVWPAIIQKEGDLYFLYAGDDMMLIPNGGGTFGGANESVSAPEALSPGKWSHLSVTYDGSTLRMYVNGLHVASLVRWFQGHINEISIDNITIQPGYVNTGWLMDVLNKGKVIKLRGTMGPTTNGKGVLLDIRNRHPGDHLLLISAHEKDLILRYFTVAATLGLPSPEIRIRGALRGINSESPFEIDCARIVNDKEYSLAINGAIYRKLGFSLGEGWSIFIHSECLPFWFNKLLNFVWIGIWSFLIGYWSQTQPILLEAIVILCSIIWWLPTVEMFVATPTAQWFAVIVGLLMGICIRYINEYLSRVDKLEHSLAE